MMADFLIIVLAIYMVISMLGFPLLVTESLVRKCPRCNARDRVGMEES